MWTNFQPTFAVVLPAFPRQPLRVRRARQDERRRKAVANGLLAVARRSGPRASVRSRGVLLVHRAAAVRPHLLELSALLRATPAPDRNTIARLHALLTDGCASPLYNPDVPAERLSAEITQARFELMAGSAGHTVNAITRSTASSISNDDDFQWGGDHA